MCVCVGACINLFLYLCRYLRSEILTRLPTFLPSSWSSCQSFPVNWTGKFDRLIVCMRSCTFCAPSAASMTVRIRMRVLLRVYVCVCVARESLHFKINWAGFPVHH